jgi:hypothetical protein
MPREDQFVVRSSVEAERIWSLYIDANIDENFHPKTPPSLAPLPPLTTSNTQNNHQNSPHLLPYQRQIRPNTSRRPQLSNLQTSREVERKVYRKALSELDVNTNNIDRDKIKRLEAELTRLKKDRALLLKANVVMAKCMEKMAL